MAASMEGRGVVFFFKQKTAYEMLRSLVGSEMCIRDSQYTLRLPVTEARALVRALAEPVAVFAFREDENLALDGSVVSESSSSSLMVQHWGISLLHWGSVADTVAMGDWSEQKALSLIHI
eukprot:TRINITY_DN28730_c0_g1_i1.p2 TRINITY_DN28730_c0_g1~~TRINITY_DN28730_c0_g1_i1.p2  ORF type:complete len:120 (+),score=34.87 TRINITY_DN28730_c0_g1_i1:37-396(+)